MADDYDIDALVNLEQTFFDAGHEDGFAHGRIHGLIEGRALGREKGFEIWEELGFYEGFALVWHAVLTKESRTHERTFQNVTQLLELIRQFPRVNPSTTDPASAELDISKLLRQIQSRYKMLCASLGVKSSLRAGAATKEEGDEADSEDREQRRVWKLEEDAKRPLQKGLSF